MIYLNLEITLLQSPQYVGAEPVERATWLSLLAWCCGQENGGRIVGAAGWKDRQWQQTCGVTLAEVNTKSALYWWDGPDLVVWAYPCEKEAHVRAKRAAGGVGGSVTSDAKREAARENGARGGRPKTHSETQTQAETQAENPTTQAQTQGKGKEWNGMEGGETRGGAKPAPAPVLILREGGNLDTLVDASERIASLRPEWNRPSEWSRAELRELFPLAEEWATLPEPDLDSMRAYLAWTPKSTDRRHWWQPVSRAKAASTLSDLLAAALRWQREQKPNRAAPRDHLPYIPEPITPEELAEIDKLAQEALASIR